MAEREPATDVTPDDVGEGPPSEWGGLRRNAFLVGAVLLICALAVGVQWLTGAHTFWAIVLSPLIFVRSVVWKVGFNRLLMILGLALVPVVLRRRGRIYMQLAWHRTRQALRKLIARINRAVTLLPVWLRIFLGLFVIIIVMAAALLSGVLLWLLALLPFVAKTTIGVSIIRYLAHKAAATGLTQAAPMAWRAIPAPIRTWVLRRYRHLWWWTMRRIVKNRRRVEHTLRRRRARKRLSGDGNAAPPQVPS